MTITRRAFNFAALAVAATEARPAWCVHNLWDSLLVSSYIQSERWSSKIRLLR
jgi:hypothetical protein